MSYLYAQNGQGSLLATQIKELHNLGLSASVFLRYCQRLPV